MAYEAVNQYFAPKTESDRRYVAVLLLDATWDPGSNMIRGHAAMGGSSGLIQMGIFGSQSLHAWPSYIEEVTPAVSLIMNHFHHETMYMPGRVVLNNQNSG